MSPLEVSLLVAATSTAFGVVVGLPLAVALHRVSRSRWLIDAVLGLPLVLPPAVVGWAMLDVLGNNTPFGRAISRLTGQPFLFSWQAVAAASFVLGLPLFVRAVAGALARVETELWETARLDGATETQIWHKIGFPMAGTGIASGVVLAFSRALGEFGAALIVGGQIAGSTETLATALWTAIESGNRADAMRWAVWLAAGSLLLNIGAARWSDRNTGRLTA